MVNRNSTPEPEYIDDICNKYYVVFVEGFAHPEKAMYLKDENGECAWYVNYFAKIIRPVICWIDPEDVKSKVESNVSIDKNW